MKTRSCATPRKECTCNDEYFAEILMEFSQQIFQEAFKSSQESTQLAWGANKKRPARASVVRNYKGLPPSSAAAANTEHKKRICVGDVGKIKKRKSPDTPIDFPVPEWKIRFVMSGEDRSSGDGKDKKDSIFGPTPTTEEEARSGLTIQRCLSSQSSIVSVQSDSPTMKSEIPDLNTPVLNEEQITAAVNHNISLLQSNSAVFRNELWIVRAADDAKSVEAAKNRRYRMMKIREKKQGLTGFDKFVR